MRRFVVWFALTCCRAFAQAEDSSVVFEAASVKPFPEGASIMMSGCQGGPGSDDPGRINCEYTSLKMLLMRAYKVKGQEVFGPGWMETAHFNITAKLPAGATREQVPAMFQNLLAERFKLALHREKRLMTAYSLTVAKGGLKIKESAPPAPAAAGQGPAGGGRLPIGDDGFPVLRPAVIASGPITLFRQGRARLQAGNTRLATLAEAFSNQLDRVVIDETGLTGKYDITLYWTPDTNEPGGRVREGAGDASMPDADLFVAVEQQLGLKLVAKKIERESLVIDRAEKVPTEN